MGNKVFTFGDIRIREVKGKYYVYLIEKGDDGQRRDRYVGSLDRVIEFYVSGGCAPTVPRPGFEPGSQARKACILSARRA